jgi:endonuclease/exonuclease/phosphatase family metal-dependent hydrolase
MSTARVLLPALLLGLASLATQPGHAADQAIRGTKLAVKNPDSSDASRRKLSFSARDRDAAHTLSGDPSTPASSGGAVLQVLLEGTNPSAQTFVLPQRTTLRPKGLWRRLGSDGFRYSDPRGEHGPVRSLRVKRSSAGSFSLAAKLHGKHSPLELVPPNSGTGAFVTLALGSGDRYCVRFGDGTLREGGERSFEVKAPLGEGCPSMLSGELLALAYNVAGLPAPLSGSEPDLNMPLIAPLLNGYDLVLVQESWKTPELNPFDPARVYHEILEAGSLHPFRSVSAPLPFGSDPSRPEALVSDGLNRFSNVPFEDVTRVPWDDCHNSAADCLALKGFSMARTTLAPGVNVDVYNLHMEAGGDPEDEVLRDAGVTQLVGFMETHSAGRAVIIGGDFNLHTDEEPDATQYQRLLGEAGLVDVCAALACPEPGRIDKFAFRSAGGVTLTPLLWRFETDVFVREDLEPLSDHDALAVRFGWEIGFPN